RRCQRHAGRQSQSHSEIRGQGRKVTVDFNEVVGGPTQDVFARPIIVTPLKSQPGAAPYAARGIYDERPLDIDLADGAGELSTADITAGVRRCEFTVPPVAGDHVEIPAHLTYPVAGTFTIDDVKYDGQGGDMWTIKKIAP